MIVSAQDFDSVLKLLGNKEVLAIDTETDGLYAYRGNRLFSIIIADQTDEYYFNFNSKNLTDKRNGIEPLPRTYLNDLQLKLFKNPKILWVGANIKFDMSMLLADGCELAGRVWDVLVMARIERNDHMKYSLAECASRIKKTKSKEVDEWIKKNKAYKKIKIPGKKGEVNQPQFWAVPLDIISRYGCQDARVTYDLYLHQNKTLLIEANTLKKLRALVRNEMALTKVCFDIERVGIKIDKEYCINAMFYEIGRAEKAAKEFKELTGKPLVDSNKNLAETLKGLVDPDRTEKGNASFTEDILSKSEHPAAKAILRYRESNKRATSYYSSFMHHADSQSVVHCNIRQSATSTGRFAISDPALQTLHSDEGESEWKVRRSFVPRDGFIFVAIDYAAFEFRAMLDLAGERGLAGEIERGLDPHQATADSVGISRSQAKTLNFGLLYGMGVGKLAGALGISEKEAKSIRETYFEKLPKIREFIKDATTKAFCNKRVINHFDRPYYFIDPNFTYKAANSLIQGGTADAIKFAMVKIHDFLKDKKSRMVLQIHDEILFEIHKDERELIEPIKKIMEDAWPSLFHKMECSVEWSDKSWGDMKEYGPETGDEIQKKSSGTSTDDPRNSNILNTTSSHTRNT